VGIGVVNVLKAGILGTGPRSLAATVQYRHYCMLVVDPSALGSAPGAEKNIFSGNQWLRELLWVMLSGSCKVLLSLLK